MEEHRAIQVGVSPKQMISLRKGRPVRVKPPSMGTGVVVVVSPGKHSMASRLFSKNKGMQLQLSPEEIAMNKEMEPQMEGKGIFGKSFDRAVGKVIGKKNRKIVYDAARELLPLAQSGLVGGLTSAGTALAVAQPELAPFIPAAVAGLSTLGTDYLANPSQYQTTNRKKLGRTLAGKTAQNLALQSLNKELGTNMDSMSTAGLSEAVVNKAKAKLIERQMESKEATGAGLYAGSGLYLSSRSSGQGFGDRGGVFPGLYKSRGYGLYQRMISPENPALQSQPYAENFAFKNSLPVQFQKYKM